MYRSMNFFAVIATAGIIALKTVDIQSFLPDPREFLPPCVDQKVHDYYAFKAQFDDTLKALERGEISLRHAHRRVKSDSLRYWPNYLSNLRLVDQGENTDERIAYNLVGHIQYLSEFGKASPARVAELESELSEYLVRACDADGLSSVNERQE